MLADDGTCVLPHAQQAGRLREPVPRVPVRPRGPARRCWAATSTRCTVLGLDATPEVKADFEKRRTMADKLLKLDPLGLRHKLPREAFVWLHATGRRVAYRFTNTEQVGGQSGITDEEFFITDRTSTRRRWCCSRSLETPLAERPRRLGTPVGPTAAPAPAEGLHQRVDGQQRGGQQGPGVGQLELGHPVEVDDEVGADLLGHDEQAAAPSVPTHTTRSTTCPRRRPSATPVTRAVARPTHGPMKTTAASPTARAAPADATGDSAAPSTVQRADAQDVHDRDALRPAPWRRPGTARAG